MDMSWLEALSAFVEKIAIQIFGFRREARFVSVSYLCSLIVHYGKQTVILVISQVIGRTIATYNYIHHLPDSIHLVENAPGR